MTNSAERSWWQNPWTCGIGGCCLGCVVVPAAMLMILGGGAFIMAKSMDVYQDAVAMVKEDPRAIELLGEPIETGWQFNGSINTNSSGGEASFSVPVSGSKGSGRLEVEAEKAGGEWVYQRIRIYPDDGGPHLDLVESPRVLEEPLPEEDPSSTGAL